MALEAILVYGAHLGLDGSALGTVIAQLGMGVAFLAVVAPLPAPVPEPGVLSLAMLGGSLTFAFLKRRNQSTK